ncbi:MULTISPECIES: DUF5134 domain-containing protein [unclassified Actinopolyspora]|uniref:DUF5134 domain-containing protein n=1 Tax=unclassified Actinopolyspora TaxID=2639451 RepID=UPI0013F6488E|nr:MULTISPECIES: DUF5134 domain-containing protein [unclassified Actinopolyspora]NHD15541.1 DUF5134 domain-containing protein [Actinopolyspora sp. BKK2]NHE75245.1 DUF5134 domain-containing protein [Actinopolyspora sp. BKK1]
MDAPMGMSLLPDWSRPLWALLLVVVFAQHALHAGRMSGQPRWWHVGHTLMAAGMAVMYLLPHMRYPGLYRAGLVLFALVALVEVVAAGVIGRREGGFNPLWGTAAAGMLIMTYMMVPLQLRPSWLTLVLVAYLCCETVIWAGGLWQRLPSSRTPPRLPPTGVELSTAPGAAGPAPAGGSGRGFGLVAHRSLGVRLSLAVMAASMAYMLTASVF